MISLSRKTLFTVGLLTMTVIGCDGDPIQLPSAGGSLASGGRSGSGGGAAGSQGGSPTSQPPQTGGVVSSGGILSEGGIRSAGGAVPVPPASGGCCNALYCPSGDTMVSTWVTTCPVGASCYEFTACGCNQVLCARGSAGSGGSVFVPHDASSSTPDAEPAIDTTSDASACVEGGPCGKGESVCGTSWYVSGYYQGVTSCYCTGGHWLCQL
jgi:hypothetical protein